MARPQTNGYEYDTIDLTLSSPEPEPQPRPSQHVRAPPRQTQLYFGHQPRPYSLPRVKNEPSQPAAFSPAPAAAQQTRLIHPTHLREIVSTTSPYALQKVILEMCQISPAFSGALVRGLAPYSTSAQTMMNQHRMNHGQWHAGVQDLDDSDNAYEIMKRKLARPNLPNPTSDRLPEQMSQSRGGPSRQHLHTSQTLAHVKNEPGTPSTPSSDGELRRPGLSSQKERRPMTNRTPSYTLPESSSTSDRKPLTLGQVQEAAAAGMTDICTRCHEPFSNASQPCIHHPGRTMKKENGAVVWSCCEQGILSAGCDIVARHIGIDEEIEDGDIPRKRPSASPAPDSARQKRPRAFGE